MSRREEEEEGGDGGTSQRGGRGKGHEFAITTINELLHKCTIQHRVLASKQKCQKNSPWLSPRRCLAFLTKLASSCLTLVARSLRQGAGASASKPLETRRAHHRRPVQVRLKVSVIHAQRIPSEEGGAEAWRLQYSAPYALSPPT